MLYYRSHDFPVAADDDLGATLARINACLDRAGIKNPRFRFHFLGACDTIVAKFPEFRRFVTTATRDPGGAPVEYLSNLGPSAPGALAGPEGDVAPETIAAVVSKIPGEFGVWGVHLLLGPIPADATPLQPSHLRSALMELHAQCLQLGWQSTPTMRGQRYFLNFIEALPSADETQPVPAWVQALESEFPGASTEKIISDLDWIMIDYRMVVTSGKEKKFLSHKSIGDIELPHRLPDSKSAAQLEDSPLMDVRTPVARVFAPDGWKQARGAQPIGTYALKKLSRNGRQLTLTFRIQSPAGSPRSMSATMEFASELGPMRLNVPAERSARHEYEVPNPQVLSQVLDNMRVVVQHLEKTWVAELEEALGPIRRKG